jgi:alanine-synthesizing transaminase
MKYNNPIEAIDTIKNVHKEKMHRGEQVWDLSMVNPDLQPPRLLMDRLLEFVTKGNNHRYAVSRGVRRLREAFAIKYERQFKQIISPESEVCVCLGSKDGVFNILRATVGPGERVLIGAPSYPAHQSAVELVGGSSIAWQVPFDPQQAYVSLDKLLSVHSPRVVLLNMPANPSGAVVGYDWWERVATCCARHDVLLVNDFVYGEMCFAGGPAVSALVGRQHGARCIEVYSLSKAYNVPGWRVGGIVGDAEVVRNVARLKAKADYGLFLPLQYAASFALSSEEGLVADTVNTYRRRLRVVMDGLQGVGCEMIEPQAGACLWMRLPEMPSIEGNGRSKSIDFATELLQSENIVVTPGILFGAEYDQWIRLAAVTSEERLREAARRIGSFVKQVSEV